MTQKEKQLLLKDLCARLPYGVILRDEYRKGDYELKCIDVNGFINYDLANIISHIKPYLRPMSSMTEEEILELYKITYDTYYSDSLYYKYEEWIEFRDSIKNNNLCFKSCIWLSNINKVIDWLNAYYFDYRGLIPMGLALPAKDGMYDSEN